MDRRINHPTPGDLQIRHLRTRHGLTQRQADLLAGLLFGEPRK